MKTTVHLLSPCRLALLFALLGSFLEAQDNQINILKVRVEQIEKEISAKRFVDLTQYDDHSGFGTLLGYSKEEGGRILKVQNSVSNHDDSHLEQHYFFDEEGNVFAVTNDSLSNFPDGSQKFVSETTFFENSAYIGALTREGLFKKGEEFAVEKLEPEILGDYTPEPEHASFLFEMENRTAQRIRRLVKALSASKEKLPENLLLDTISPNGRFLVRWKEIDPAEGSCGFQLYDLESKSNLVELPKGRIPGDNHVYHSSEWSRGSEFFVFLNDSKWTTESAPIVQVDSEKVAARVVGDLYQTAGNYAWAELKKAGHPFSKSRDTMHGFVQIESLYPDGSVDLVLDSQSKFEGPENNVRTAMTIQRPGDVVMASGFVILGEEEQAVFAKLPRLMISSNKVGPITRETPFNLKAIRALFPKHEVVAAKETVEEGGETPVILVKARGDSILTIVPLKDEVRIGNVYTSSPQVTTETGIAVGNEFGKVFKKTGRDVVLEGMTGDVITALPGVPNISLRFLPKDPGSEIGDLPPFSQLKDWKLHTIEWFPNQ